MWMISELDTSVNCVCERENTVFFPGVNCSSHKLLGRLAGRPIHTIWISIFIEGDSPLPHHSMLQSNNPHVIVFKKITNK